MEPGGDTLLQYQKASDLEQKYPEEAYNKYKILESRNRPYSLSILLTAIISSSAAFLVTYWHVNYTGNINTLVATTILVFLGFVPPIFLYKIRLDIIEAHYRRIPINFLRAILVTIFNAILEFLGLFIPIIIVTLEAFIMAVPLILLVNLILHFSLGWPFYWQNAEKIQGIALGFIIVFSLIAYLTHIATDLSRLPNRKPWAGAVFFWPAFLKNWPLVFKYGRSNLFELFGNIIIGVVLFMIVTDMNNKVSIFGIIEYIFAGLILGLEFSRKLEKDFLIGFLIKISIVRCLIKINRWKDAIFTLRDSIEELPHFIDNPFFQCLSGIMGYYIRGCDINDIIQDSLDSSLDFDHKQFKAPNDEQAYDYFTESMKNASEALKTIPKRYHNLFWDTIDKTAKFTGVRNYITTKP